jgi:3-hydroxyisobutyrate dehydrogenase-like beta-hydroxyacid dehydrogenase
MTGVAPQQNGGSARPPVTVIGTGTMGSALARALLAAGYPVTAWNRTPHRAARLASAGASIADNLAVAVQASDLVLMCVSDQAAVHELLSGDSLADLLRGRTLVQLTTGTAADGRQNAAWAAAHGFGYVDAAILAYPREIGTAGAEIFYCGPSGAAAGLEPVLAALGSAHFLGEDAGSAAVVDAALIAFFYGTLTGFLQCAALASAEGIAINDLLELTGPFFERFVANAVTETGVRIVQSDYREPQSSMVTHLGGIDLLVLGSSRDAGIDVGVVTAIRDIFARAVSSGHGDDDIAVLAELLRSPRAEPRGY